MEDVTHVLVIQAVWDGSVPAEIVAIYASHDVIEAFERLDQLRAEQRVHSSWSTSSTKYDSASFIISLFALEATA